LSCTKSRFSPAAANDRRLHDSTKNPRSSLKTFGFKSQAPLTLVAIFSDGAH
jgi:hypothetical protein